MGRDSDRSDSESLKAAQLVTKRHLCHYEGCTAAFSRPGRLRIHLDFHEGKLQKLFKCDVDGCNKSYVRNAHLKRHVTIAHEKQGYVPVFTCREAGCMSQLSNETNLRRHYQQVHCKPYTCETCGAGFNKQNKLATHVARHTGVFSFKCDICEARYARNHQLKQHMSQHKTYPCPHSDCGSCFHRWSHLRKHLKLEHPPEFRCSDCPKVFTCKWKLKMHVQVHLHPLNREVLQCPDNKCPRFYFHKCNLMHHVKSSHEGRRFACDHAGCERTFCTKLKMQEHQKLHDPSARLPRRRCKSRRKRKDVGKPKRSIAAKLSGVSVPYHVEKHILERPSKLENLFMAEETENLLRSETCTTAVVDNSRLQNEGSSYENTPDVGEAHCSSHQWLEDVAITNIENICAEADSSTAPASDPRDLPVADTDNPTNLDVPSIFISSTEANLDRPCLPEDCDRSDITEEDCELDSNLQMLLHCSRLLAQNATNMQSLDQRVEQGDMSLQEIADPNRNSQESVASKTTPWLTGHAAEIGRRDACSPKTSERAPHLNKRRSPFENSDAQLAAGCQNKNGKHLTKSRTLRTSCVLPRASGELRTRDDTDVTGTDCADVGSDSLRTKADLSAWKYENFVSSTVPSSEPDAAGSSVSTHVRTRENEDPGACVSSTVTVSDVRAGTVCDSRWQVSRELACTDAEALPSSQHDSRLRAGLCGGMDETEGRAGSEEGGYAGSSSCENCQQCARCMDRRKKKRRRSTSIHKAKMQLPRLFSVVSTQQWLSAMLLAMRLTIPEIEDPISHQAQQSETRENSDFH